MPLKLVLVALAVAAMVALSSYEAYVDIPDPMDMTIVSVGLGVLGGVVLRRQWLRPLGLTFACILLLFGLFGFGFAVSAGRPGAPAASSDPAIVAANAARFVTGLVVMWCMRHRDTIRWLAEVAARRLG